jgi:hypothetical protein
MMVDGISVRLCAEQAAAHSPASNGPDVNNFILMYELLPSQVSGTLIVEVPRYVAMEYLRSRNPMSVQTQEGISGHHLTLWARRLICSDSRCYQQLPH